MKAHLVLAVLVAFVSIPVVLACSCLPSPPPKEALAKASAVFAGTVKKIETVTEKTPVGEKTHSFNHKKVTVEVTESWKGTNAATLAVFTATDGAACGFSFAQGQQYLIYAYAARGTATNEMQLEVSLCSRTCEWSTAGEDLKALGAGRKPPTK